jgi:hypothetical protein
MPQNQKKKRKHWFRIILVAIIVLILLLVLPCLHEWIYPVRVQTAYLHSMNNLKSIGYALHTYYDQNGHLPPAVVFDKEGRPLYSWRVLLLPYIEEGSRYEKFHLDEPWDSPHNLPLTKITPGSYRSFASEEGFTEFQALVGPGTAFERPGLTWADFPNGLDSTILVVEAADSVPWAKPVDLIYDPVGPLPQLKMHSYKPLNFLCYKFAWRKGFAACFADASLHHVRNSTNEQQIRAIITRNRKEKVDVSSLE